MEFNYQNNGSGHDESNSVNDKATLSSLSRPGIHKPGLGLGVLFGLALVFLIITSVVSQFIFHIKGETVGTVRIATLFQDILVFILPAIFAAMCITRLPATLLMLDKRLRWNVVLMALVVWFTSMPAMDFIVEWNQNIHLPESMSGLEEMLRYQEDTAGNAVNMLSGGTSVMDLILSILIIGVMAGLSEELFFRGAMQNMLVACRMNPHIAIWIGATVFSFVHFQFFGFVPRMLLGAYFGYLLWWTGSVWVPVIVHAVNNSALVVVQWLAARNGIADEAGTDVNLAVSQDYMTILLSVVVSALGLVILHRMAHRPRRP